MAARTIKIVCLLLAVLSIWISVGRSGTFLVAEETSGSNDSTETDFG